MTDPHRGDKSPRDPAVAPGGDHSALVAGHETQDVSIRTVVRFGVALAVLMAVVLAAMWGVFRLFETRAEKRDQPVSPMIAANLHRTPSGPRLEPDPLAPRRAARAREDAILRSYGWVDSNVEIARIPIERAMELLVQRGLPAPKPMSPVVTPAPADGRPKTAGAERTATP